jgi:hypothetical protein
VLAFPAHIIVAADVSRRWLDSWIPSDDYTAPTSPPFLAALEDLTRLNVDSLDVLLLAPPLPGPPSLPLTEAPASDHPRVTRANNFRSDVRVWTSPAGLLILGRGLAGRWEVAFEVPPDARNRGNGRALAAAARHLVPNRRPVWAQCAPGNATSLRTVLAAGYAPVGSEVLLTTLQ